MYVSVSKHFVWPTALVTKRFQNLRKKMPVGAVVPEADRRGRHGNHRRVPEAIKDQVREHLRSFPA